MLPSGERKILVTVSLDDTTHLQEWGFHKHFCYNCSKPNSEMGGLLMQCAKCKKAYYCTMKCFNEHLPAHQMVCNTGELLHQPCVPDIDISVRDKPQNSAPPQKKKDKPIPEATRDDEITNTDEFQVVQALYSAAGPVDPIVEPIVEANPILKNDEHETLLELHEDETEKDGDNEDGEEGRRRHYVFKQYELEGKERERIFLIPPTRPAPERPTRDGIHLRHIDQEKRPIEKLDPDWGDLRHKETEKREHDTHKMDWPALKHCVPGSPYSVNDLDFEISLSNLVMDKDHSENSDSEAPPDHNSCPVLRGVRFSAKQLATSPTNRIGGFRAARMDLSEANAYDRDREIVALRSNGGPSQSKKYGWQKPEWANRSPLQNSKSKRIFHIPDNSEDDETWEWDPSTRDLRNVTTVEKREFSWERPQWATQQFLRKSLRLKILTHRQILLDPDVALKLLDHREPSRMSNGDEDDDELTEEYIDAQLDKLERLGFCLSRRAASAALGIRRAVEFQKPDWTKRSPLRKSHNGRVLQRQGSLRRTSLLERSLELKHSLELKQEPVWVAKSPLRRSTEKKDGPKASAMVAMPIL